MLKTLFLPGATGSASFWKPVARRAGLDGVFFAWPGLGSEPPSEDVGGMDDLIAMVERELTEPVNIVAQSMGSLIAIRMALAFPGLVKRLVLTATSGGIPVAELGAVDWRPDYFAAFPQAARWIAEPAPDLSALIPTINVPTLLLWGDDNAISPVAVGRRLSSLLPDARFCIVHGAGHDLALTHADAAATEIRRHLIGAS